MTQLKEQRRSIRKRLDALSSLYRSIKDKDTRLDLGNMITAKLDEIAAFCQQKGLNTVKEEKKKKKDKKAKGGSEAPRVTKKLEPSKDLFNEPQHNQNGNDETGNN